MVGLPWKDLCCLQLSCLCPQQQVESKFMTTTAVFSAFSAIPIAMLSQEKKQTNPKWIRVRPPGRVSTSCFFFLMFGILQMVLNQWWFPQSWYYLEVQTQGCILLFCWEIEINHSFHVFMSFGERWKSHDKIQRKQINNSINWVHLHSVTL